MTIKDQTQLNNELLEACYSNDIKAAKQAIEEGANVNTQDKDGLTALMHTTYTDAYEIAKLLIEAGADIETKDNNGRTALDYCRMQEMKDLILKRSNATRRIKMVIERQIDLNNKLLKACYNDLYEVAKQAIKAGANVNAQDVDGRTALMLSNYNNSYILTKLLLDAGADVNAKDKDDRTPLMFVSLCNAYKTAQLLLEAGADINAQDKEGWTALICASNSNSLKTAQLLIENGADIDAKDNEGKTAIDYCRMQDMKNIILKRSNATMKHEMINKITTKTIFMPYTASLEDWKNQVGLGKTTLKAKNIIIITEKQRDRINNALPRAEFETNQYGGTFYTPAKPGQEWCWYNKKLESYYQVCNKIYVPGIFEDKWDEVWKLVRKYEEDFKKGIEVEILY